MFHFSKNEKQSFQNEPLEIENQWECFNEMYHLEKLIAQDIERNCPSWRTEIMGLWWYKNEQLIVNNLQSFRLQSRVCCCFSCEITKISRSQFEFRLRSLDRERERERIEILQIDKKWRALLGTILSCS